jgi:hypothetical protein
MPEQVVDSSRAFELFKQLFDKTRNKKLSWSPTAQSGVFLAPIEGKYLFRALPAVQQEHLPETFRDGRLQFPRFQLLEGDDTLMVISSEHVKGDNLNTLYELVQRQALRIDEKLSKVDGVLTKLREL